MNPRKFQGITSLIALVVAAAGGVLSISATLVLIPGISPQIAQAWPTVLAVATIIQTVGNAIAQKLKEAEREHDADAADAGTDKRSHKRKPRVTTHRND